MNQFVWNLQSQPAEKAEGMILWNGVPDGMKVPPGQYSARFKVGKDSVDMDFLVKADPNYKCSQEEYEAQYRFLSQVKDKFNEVQKTIKSIREIRGQLNDFVARQGKDCPKEVKEMADTINKQGTLIEEALYQTKSKSVQDVLNFPIRLNDKLTGVFNTAASGNMPPSKQVTEVYADLAAQCDVQLAKWKALQQGQLDKFNKLIREKGLPLIGSKKE